MSSVSFELSEQGIRDAAAFNESFVFVVGGVEYPCCRFQACFLSGLVRRLLASDCCLSRVCLKVGDDGHHFEDVVRLMNWRKISITPENAKFLEECARELENDELLGAVVGFQLGRDISLSNLAYRFSRKREFHGDCKSELDFLASHFFEAELDVLRGLSVSELELVLTNPLLRMKDEDQLYDTIISLAVEKGDEVLVLLRHVEVAFLSQAKVGEFLDRIFPDLVAHVWGPLCQGLRCLCGLSTKASLMKPKRYGVEFTSDKGAFNGIVQHLRGECGGNPHEKGVISITASSNNHRHQCHQLVDYGWNSYWGTNSAPNSWVQFDFKSRRVCLSHYSLKSDGNSSHHLLSWVLEVSDDGSTWEAVDERNTQDLNGAYVVKTYECSKRSNRFVRFVRLRQTGKNSYNYDHLMLSEIEFFGKLREP